MALKTAVMLRTPPLLAALRAFAASQRGSTAMRQQAAAVVAEMEPGAPVPAVPDEPAQEEA
jgi:hypothetical protein